VLQGPDKGRRFELPDALALIGRENGALALDDNTVSRRHAELIPKDGQWILRDLGSSNGTYINGQRVIHTYELKLGDQIRVGRSLLVFGAQPGVTRTSSRNVSLAGAEAGMDSSIMHTMPSNEDSMVLAVPEPAAAAVGNLKLLYQLGAALGTSFDIQQVLEIVMDLVFENVKADRGIILLTRRETGDLETKVARARVEGARQNDKPTEPVKHEKIHASRTIINHVVASGEGVLSSNAMTDHRFSKGKSVHNLGIRSALCVPIKARRLDRRDLVRPTLTGPTSASLPSAAPTATNGAKGAAAAPAAKAAANGNAAGDEGGDEVLGVIYIDSSVKNYTYSPDQLRLLTAIGQQAGLAVQNAMLYAAGLKAERLAAVGETTAALSHSIKNILQALRGGADVVEMGLRSSNLGQSQKGWRIVDRNLQKIYNLTMNLLAYSRPREPKLAPIHPRALIDDCIELIAPSAAEKGVMAVADVDDTHPAIPLDADGLHQVLVNLLSNALDAVEPKKGLIRVVCRYDDANRQSVIEVIDNGPGIEPSMMPHLFELFHSTKGNRGTGIGLAVSKKIVDEHEGTISVRSVPGEGATFTVRLPAANDSMPDLSSTHGPPQ
jgi:signal transduction histidine kinase/pSer/pThr/pTyr-binding forkhead associated (FHA) protein